MRVALLYSRIRVEERLLLEELARRGVEHEAIDVRTAVWDLGEARGLYEQRPGVSTTEG